MRALGRALRRAELPIAYSQGYHPLPRLALGPPLPLGIESEAEYVDLVFTAHYTEAEILEMLNTSLPQGLEITEVKEATQKVRSLTATINQLDYAYFIENPSKEDHERSRDLLIQSLQMLWDQEELPVIRKKKNQEKKVDIRPLWKGYEFLPTEQELHKLKLMVEYGPEGTIRPEDFLSYLPPGFEVQKIMRVGAWIVNAHNDRIITPTAVLGT